MKNGLQYDVNLGSVARWRQRRNEIDLRNYPHLVAAYGEKGTAELAASIKQRQAEVANKGGDQVDGSVGFYRAGRALWYTTVAIAGTGFVFVVVRVLMAIVSGRVTEILDRIVQASN